MEMKQMLNQSMILNIPKNSQLIRITILT